MFGKNTQAKPKAESLIKIIEKGDVSKNGYFFDINQDLECFFSNKTQVSDGILMAAMYARRFCFAGVYAQGIISRDDFNHIDSGFFQVMASIGSRISKEEQVKFQEESYDKALEWINHYYHEVRKHAASLLVCAAKAGLSLRDALQAGVEAWETDNFSQNLNLQNLSSDFCTLFYTVGGYLPNDGYNELAMKSYNFLLDPMLHPYMLISKYRLSL
ncbi:MAG TPA: hypothetical protein PKC44_09030 [Agitococcus sp.]|nr:hypothetical protein [Agitococcus sp.]